MIEFFQRIRQIWQCARRQVNNFNKYCVKQVEDFLQRGFLNWLKCVVAAMKYILELYFGMSFPFSVWLSIFITTIVIATIKFFSDSN